MNLTPRELAVLRLMAADLADKQIASELGVSEHTVRFHIKNALAKAGKQTRTGLIAEIITASLLVGLHTRIPRVK